MGIDAINNTNTPVTNKDCLEHARSIATILSQGTKFRASQKRDKSPDMEIRESYYASKSLEAAKI